jgi:hypothetical protein
MKIPVLSSLRELGGRLKINRDEPGHATLLHGNAYKLLSKLHGNFVMGDEQELGLTRHGTDHIAVSLCIGIIKRGINLIEQAKRRRIKLKNRKHKRYCRQGFFTA